MQIIYIGIGGFFGSILRYSIGLLLISFNFPLSTLLVNLIGSLLLAYVYTISTKKMTQTLRLALGVGFCGSFTTFSTFSLDLVTILSQEGYFLFSLYLILSIVGGLLFTYLGFSLANKKEVI